MLGSIGTILTIPVFTGSAGANEGEEISPEMVTNARSRFAPSHIEVGESTSHEGEWEIFTPTIGDWHRLKIFIEADSLPRPVITATNLDSSKYNGKFILTSNHPLNSNYAWMLDTGWYLFVAPFGQTIYVDSFIDEANHPGTFEAKVGYDMAWSQYASAWLTVDGENGGDGCSGDICPTDVPMDDKSNE